jgi:hypothetical protein
VAGLVAAAATEVGSAEAAMGEAGLGEVAEAGSEEEADVMEGAGVTKRNSFSGCYYHRSPPPIGDKTRGLKRQAQLRPGLRQMTFECNAELMTDSIVGGKLLAAFTADRLLSLTT